MPKINSTIEKIVSAVEKLSEWSGKTSSWLVLGMVAVMSYEAAVRYIFDSPTIWAHELTTMLYGSYCLLVGAYTYLYNGHVRMDAIYRRFSRRTKATVDFFTGWLALGFLGAFLLMMTEHTVESWAYAEYSTGSPWAPPLYPFKAALAVAVLLLLLQHIAWLTRNLALMLNKKGFLPKLQKEHTDGSN